MPDPGYNPSERLPVGVLNKKRGFRDRFGNVWAQGPSRDPRFEYEWDVQLSRKGKARFGDRTHINVSPDGYFTH